MPNICFHRNLNSVMNIYSRGELVNNFLHRVTSLQDSRQINDNILFLWKQSKSYAIFYHSLILVIEHNAPLAFLYILHIVHSITCLSFFLFAFAILPPVTHNFFWNIFFVIWLQTLLLLWFFFHIYYWILLFSIFAFKWNAFSCFFPFFLFAICYEGTFPWIIKYIVYVIVFII